MSAVDYLVDDNPLSVQITHDKLFVVKMIL